MAFQERLHPRARDGKFAHEPGGGALRVATRTAGGGVAREAGKVAGNAGGGPWTGAGTRHQATINGNTYHLHRSGGAWNVYHGDPADKRKIATASSITAAKAHAHEHAQKHGSAPATKAAPAPPARAAAGSGGPKEASVAELHAADAAGRKVHVHRYNFDTRKWERSTDQPVSVKTGIALAESGNKSRETMRISLADTAGQDAADSRARGTAGPTATVTSTRRNGTPTTERRAVPVPVAPPAPDNVKWTNHGGGAHSATIGGHVYYLRKEGGSYAVIAHNDEVARAGSLAEAKVAAVAVATGNVSTERGNNAPRPRRRPH